MRQAVSVLGFLMALAVWTRTLGWAGGWGPSMPSSLPTVLLAATLLPLPVLGVGRWVLDRRSRPGQADWVTVFVHYGTATPLGVAVIVAIVGAQRWPCAEGRWAWLPCTGGLNAIGTVLVVVTGLALISTVVNLAVRGLGAPFAIAQTTRLASDRLYAWTRNPMVLAGLALLVSIGLRLGSWWLIGWTLLLVTPVMLAFLKVYEERELEIRFGEAYKAYRRKTPLLFPRRPGT